MSYRSIEDSLLASAALWVLVGIGYGIYRLGCWVASFF